MAPGRGLVGSICMGIACTGRDDTSYEIIPVTPGLYFGFGSQGEVVDSFMVEEGEMQKYKCLLKKRGRK